MTDEANVCVEILRKAARFGVMDCQYCPAYSVCPTGTAGWNDECMLETAANLIESLSAELEITEGVAAQARGLECERDQLMAELEHVKCERDAAVQVLEENPRCETCKHYTPGYFCLGCRRGDKWQWRGVKP